MLFSPSARYAILALAYLAGQEPKKPMAVTSIAENAGVPAKFLAKILISLKNHQVLKAVKGPGGGYYLFMPAEKVRIIDIVKAVESSYDGASRCVLGLDMCTDDHPCPLHWVWKSFRADVDDKIHSLTLLELSEKLKEKRTYLKAPPLEPEDLMD